MRITEFKAFESMGRGFTDGYLGVEEPSKAVACEFELDDGTHGDIVAEPAGVEIHTYSDDWETRAYQAYSAANEADVGEYVDESGDLWRRVAELARIAIGNELIKKVDELGVLFERVV